MIRALAVAAFAAAVIAVPVSAATASDEASTFGTTEGDIGWGAPPTETSVPTSPPSPSALPAGDIGWG